MNTTFTTYAAKAKQFLNLLQGYTKGIRFTAILILLLMGVSNAWAWCGDSYITVNGTWYTASNAYVQPAGKFHDNNLGALTTLTLGGELQVWPSSSTAASLGYKIDNGTNKSISLPKTGTYGENSKHSGSGTVDLSGLAPGNHTIEVWFNHGSDYDSNGNANYKASFTIDPVPTLEISTNQQYLRAGKDKLQLDIDYKNIPEGHYYRVHATPEAYFNGNEKGDNVYKVEIKGTNQTNFISSGFLSENTYTVELILLKGETPTGIKSNQITITVEPHLSVQTRARFNDDISTTAAEHPAREWVYPSKNVGEVITANTAKTGYTFDGWTANDNNLITFETPNELQTIVKSKVNGNNQACAYANYTEIKHSIAVETNNDNLGTISPTSTTAGIATPSAYVTATPKTGCRFTGWTATDGITIENPSNQQTRITKATKAGTLTANFEEIKHAVQVSVAAGQESWGRVSTTSTNVGSVSAQQITATANTNLGYVFDHWVISDGITITTGDANSATIEITATKAGSLTAHFRGENRPQNVFLIGDMNNWQAADANWQFYKLPGENGNTVTLTKTINKSDYHAAGYEFGVNIYQAGWDDKWWHNSADNDTKMNAHNCTGWVFGTKEGNKKTYIDLSVSGEYTFTLAHSGTYNQQALSITYPDKSFIEGGFATAWDENAYPLTENGDIQTVTIPITSKGDVEFRLVSHGKLFGSNTKILVASNSQELSPKNMEDQGAVMTIGAYVEGDYVFSYNKSTKVLTVTYPSVNQLQVYSANPAHDAAKKNWDWDSQNGNVYTKTLSLNANTTYTFKAVVNSDFYGKTATLTRKDPSSTLSTEGGDVTITTDIAGNYTFTFNTSTKNLSVTYPGAYTFTYGIEANKNLGTVAVTPNIASGTLVAAGTEITITPTPNLGYKFEGWYDDPNCKNQVSTDNRYTFQISSNTTRYAKFVERDLYIHTDIIGWGTEPALMKQDDTNKAVYTYTTTLGKLLSGQDGVNWNFGYHFRIMNTDNGDDQYLAYNYDSVDGENITYTKDIIDGVHKTAEKNPTIQFGLTRKSDVTITLTLQSANDDPKPTVHIEAIPYYNITLNQANATSQSNPTSVEVKWNEAMPTITIPTRTDHLFMGYYDGDNGTGTQYYNADGTSAKNWDKTDNTTLHAKWIPYSQCIFFKNTLGWNNVYVYTFSDNVWYDNEDSNTQYGPGVCTKVNVLEFAKMTQIDNTDIYYYILTKQAGFNHIAFSDANMNNWNEFYGNNAIYRADRNDQLPLFIPKKSQTPTTTNSTKYYSSGIWMKYNSTESGYDWRGATDENNQEQWSKKFDFTASKPGGYSFTATVEFDNTSTHYFKIHNTKGDWFGNGGTMTQNNCTNWIFGSDNSNNAKITPTITGTYIFTIYLGDGEVSVSLDYPLSTGDYRLVYVDDVTGAHPGHYIKKRNEERLDTVSFFVHSQNSPRIWLQYCTEIDQNGEATWALGKEYQILKTGGANPATAQLPGKRKSDAVLHVGEGCGIEKSGVYNFVLQQSNSQAELFTDATHPYVGNFYIRTDAAEGGWDSFRQKSNQITYSSFADKHPNFNHYYCKYIDAGRNVKFTIANDYSYCISDTLDADNIIQKNGVSPGCLPADANVRFGWDSRNNKLTRAYIAGSGNVWDRFLVVTGNDLLKDASGDVISAGPSEVNDETKKHPRCNLKAHEVIFTDLGNWVYQVDVTAQNGTKINLTALYNGTIQYFKGAEGEPSYPLLASTNVGKEYKIRMIYNFKTNHLVVAWLPDSPYNANGDEYLGTDMLLIRRNQEPATQLKLNSIKEKYTISGINTAYAVMTFTKEFVGKDEKPIHERKHYWVSFPFDVKISDVFGFSEYKDHWIMQAYDGAGRAANGLWADTDTYWKYITNANYVMRKGQGYVLTLDVKKMLELDPVFTNTGEVSLYFPSRGELDTITSYVPTAATVPAHTCTIERENRKIYDSHWNMIGVPGFANIEGFNTDKPVDYLSELGYEGGSLNFYYQYIPSENSYQVVTAETTFQSMYSYMVQFAGTINWRSRVVAYNGQQQLAARRNSEGEYPEKVSFRLELAQGEEKADQTFVQLQEEGATTEFDMSLDLTKIINSGANIYTLAGESRIQSAGNALPMGEAVVVPVGVKVDAEGEYTFRMPEGTEGMVVELVDYETYNRTNLLLTDYTVTLPKGTSENRFALHIQPQKDVVTSLENIGEGVNNGEAVNKYLIDGKLIIRTADGVVYDAQGKRL